MINKGNLRVFLLVCICIPLFLGCCDDDQIDDVNPCPNCELEPMPGPCKAAIPRYYFDQEEKECREFIWGGCAGVVPFETMEECEECACN